MRAYRVFPYPDANQFTDVGFQRNPDCSTEPEVWEDSYRIEIETLSAFLQRNLKTGSEEYKRHLQRMLDTAQHALVEPGTSEKAAFMGLHGLKTEIFLKENGRLRSNYLFRTAGISLLLISLFFGAVYTTINHTVHALTPYMVTTAWNATLFYGCMCAGTVLSSTLRVSVASPDELIGLNMSDISPIYRLMFNSILAIVFALFLKSGVVVFQIGNINSTSIFTEYLVSAVSGVILGLAADKIATVVQQKSELMIDSIDRK